MKTPHSILVAAAVLVGIVFFGEGRTGVGAQDSSSAMIARIEGQQSPNRQGHDGFTLQELMQKYRVPGVSVAVIKDFEIHWAKGYGVADVETGLPVEPGTTFPGGVDQQAGDRDGGAEGGARWPLFARRRHQYPSEVMEGSTKRVHESDAGNTPRVAQSHVWSGRWFRFPRLSSLGAAANARANPCWGEALQCGTGPLRTTALHRLQVLGWRHNDHAASDDRHARQAFRRDHA